MAKEKEGPLDSKEIVKALLKETAGDHYVGVKSKNVIISTSSLILDSLVKIRSGQVVRLLAKGGELGKTSQAFVFAENYMNSLPKAKTVYIKAEARLSPEIQQRSGLTFVEDPDQWEYGTVFVFPCNIFETIAKNLEGWLKAMQANDEHLCIIWDSLDATILKDDSNVGAKKMWDGKDPKVAGVPLLTKLMFRRLALPLEYSDGLMIILSQNTTSIKLDPYAENAPVTTQISGGEGLKHQASYAFLYHHRFNKDLIRENPDPSAKGDPKNKIIGVYANVEITKSGTDVSGRKIEIPIKKGRIGCAIWKEKECVDYAIAFEYLKDEGRGRYNFVSEFVEEAKKEGVELQEKFHGLNNIYDYIENNKEVFEWMYNKFRKIVVGEN
jgi:hypothetical protein